MIRQVRRGVQDIGGLTGNTQSTRSPVRSFLLPVAMPFAPSSKARSPERSVLAPFVASDAQCFECRSCVHFLDLLRLGDACRGAT